MKKIAVIVTALILTLLATYACAASNPVDYARPNLSSFRMEVAVIVELDYDNDEVSCITHRGEIYKFRGCFDWCEYDVVALYIWNNGSTGKDDDVVIDVDLGGCFTEEMLEQWLKN